MRFGSWLLSPNHPFATVWLPFTLSYDIFILCEELRSTLTSVRSDPTSGDAGGTRTLNGVTHSGFQDRPTTNYHTAPFMEQFRIVATTRHFHSL